MEKEPVVIKGNKSGIRVILDDEMDFDELLKKATSKFTFSADFLGSAQVAISFEGRTLSTSEELALLECVKNHTKLDIVCIVDPDDENETRFAQAIDTAKIKKEGMISVYHKGSLRSGQIAEYDTGVIVLGDVNPGANIVASGNIIVLGALNGNAFAGANGNTDSFIVALKMNPLQIKIANFIARSPDERTEPSPNPQIAYLQKGEICMDDLTRDAISELRV